MSSNLIQWLWARPARGKGPSGAADYLDAVVLEDRLLYSATPMPDAPVDAQVAMVDAALALAVNDASASAVPMGSSVDVQPGMELALASESSQSADEPAQDQ